MEREAILTRVSPSLKRELEKIAEANKRSVSREVEDRLERSLQPQEAQRA